MDNAILIGMAIVLILFVWTWIGIAMMHRMSLEKKIEKLNNITNPLPEEEKTLNHYKELRAIEQSKLSSAKWVLGFFMLGLIAVSIATIAWEPPQRFFGYPPLANVIAINVVLLCFFCLPTFFGLSLANAGKKDEDMNTQETREETVEKNAAPEISFGDDVSEESAA